MIALASQSPQRRAILEAVGAPFRVVAVDVAEADEGPPEVVARENAARKALAGAEQARPGELVLGVDTVVATELEIWGKPPNRDAARETLRRLSGRTHDVVSGAAIVSEGEVETVVDTTQVTFRALDERTIEWYLGTEEWDGRAGGYAIQGRGAVLVRRIEGDYLNVVGLPLAACIERWPDLLSA